MLLGALGAKFNRKYVSSKRINRTRYGFKDFQSNGDRLVRAWYGSKRSLIKRNFNSTSYFN